MNENRDSKRDRRNSKAESHYERTHRQREEKKFKAKTQEKAISKNNERLKRKEEKKGTNNDSKIKKRIINRSSNENKPIGGKAGKKLGEKYGYDRPSKKLINPLSYKSVKENLVEDVAHIGMQKALAKATMGASIGLEKGFKFITGKDINYTKLANNKGKILIAFVALMVFLLFWLMFIIGVCIIIFGAVAIILLDDDLKSGINMDSVASVETSNSTGSAKGSVTMPEGANGDILFPYSEYVTSVMQKNRFISDRGVPQDHWGTDLDHSADRGSDGGTVPIYPVGVGTVVKTLNTFKGVDWNGAWGNRVEVLHDAKDPETGLPFYSRYAHLYPNSIEVKVDDKVYLDTVMGKQGNTGPSKGSHLHLELYVGEMKYSDPVKTKNILEYASCSADGKNWYDLGGNQKATTACYNYQLSVRGVK